MRMGYLGLDQTEVKDDNMFQRMFWPSDHAGETDQLGKQGFWVCLFVAILSGIVLFVQGHWLIGLITVLFFVLGGMGVREHSTAAAVLVAVTYLLNLVANLMIGVFPGVISLAAAVLLLANIRGTWIAAKWARSGDPDAMPERMGQTFTDKLVDQIPSKIWPATRIPFYCLSSIYVLLTIVGTVMLARKLVSTPAQDTATPPNSTLEVAPSR